jgi:hypothetical protein
MVPELMLVSYRNILVGKDHLELKYHPKQLRMVLGYWNLHCKRILQYIYLPLMFLVNCNRTLLDRQCIHQ